MASHTIKLGFSRVLELTVEEPLEGLLNRLLGDLRKFGIDLRRRGERSSVIKR